MTFITCKLKLCVLDVLQLAEALRILRITTRKIRTVLWYWLYWSTNSTTNKIPLIARHQDGQINGEPYSTIQVSPIRSKSMESERYSLQSTSYNLFYPPANTDDLDADGQQRKVSMKSSISTNENNKENECNE